MFFKKNVSLLKKSSLKEKLLASHFFLMKAVVILLSVLSLNIVQADIIPRELSHAEKSIFKISDGSYFGTGFFISEKHFVTNFHVISDLDIENTRLSQEESSEFLKVKEVLHISAIYDFALLEIEGEVSNYLKLGELETKENLYIFGYPYGMFKRIIKKKEYPIYTPEGFAYYFSVNHTKNRGASGSPILNDQREVVGLLTSGQDNIVGVIYPDILKELIQKDMGLSCLDFVDFISCMEAEIKNIKNKSEQGYAPAQFQLALMYYQVEGTEESEEKAFYWFQESAIQGYAPAQFQLAWMYYKGEGTEEIKEKAFYWFQESAIQGYVQAQYMLALMYYKVEGTEEIKEKAFYWFQESAIQGSVQAQYMLAWMYYKGVGTEEIKEKAFYWFQESAIQGYAPAQYMLAWMYYKGEGTEEIKEKAFYWFQESAIQGYVQAQYMLALMYYKGEGTEEIKEKAFYWFQESAIQGYVQAQYMLAWMYYKGVGTEESEEKAFYWYRESASQGYAPAQEELERLYYNEDVIVSGK